MGGGFSSPTCPKFSRTEELEAFRRWREDGDSRAKADLVASQAPAAKAAARRTHPNLRGADLDDAQAVALAAVARAVDRFDPTRGNRLYSLATVAVSNALVRFKPRDLRQPTCQQIAEEIPATAPGLPPDERQEIRDAIAALPQREREVVLRMFYGGMSQTEAAADLGLKRHELRAAWESASAALRRVLGK